MEARRRELAGVVVVRVELAVHHSYRMKLSLIDIGSLNHGFVDGTLALDDVEVLPRQRTFVCACECVCECVCVCVCACAHVRACVRA